MANRISGRVDFEIPEALISEHEWMTDELIDGPTGVVCKLVYPPKKTQCDNCLIDPKTGKSSSIYNQSGPYPFADHTKCPRCGGEGTLVMPQEESVRCRFYFNPREWVNIGIRIEQPEHAGQLIGYMSDLPKFQRATQIVVNSPVRNVKEWKFRPASDALPFGLSKNRYFIQLWRRI